MRTIKKGTVPDNKVKCTCTNCKTKFSYMTKDVIVENLQYDYVKCPLCSMVIQVSGLTKERKEEVDASRVKYQSDFDRKQEHLRLSVFEVKIGDMVNRIILFKNGLYEPHMESEQVKSIYWNKGVTDFSGYYKIEE